MCRARLRRGSRAAVPDEEQKLLACLDLQDHIVDLYAREYVEHEGISLTSTEKVAFRDGWAEELAKRGTFDRFEQSCFYSLTPEQVRVRHAVEHDWRPGRVHEAQHALTREAR